MTYTVKLFAWADEADDVSPARVAVAIARFKAALNDALGDAALVVPVYAAFQRIVAAHGDTPADDALSPGELAVFRQWQAAQAAAMTAALGPDRYLGEAEFEIHA